jgi:hypothetical protein
MEEVDFHSKIEQLRKQVIDFSKQFPVPGIS